MKTDQEKPIRRLNPMSDVFFRWVFSRDEESPILTDLVNAVLIHSGMPPLRDLRVLNPFHAPEIFQEKESILDIRAKEINGSYINLEVQLVSQSAFHHRLLYYWAKTYARQLKQGDDYRELSPVTSINLVQFTLFPQVDNWHNCFLLSEKNDPNFHLTRHLEIHTIETAKQFLQLRKRNCTDRRKQLTLPGDKLARWCYFLTYEGAENKISVQESHLKQLYQEEPMIKKAHQEYESFLNDQQLMYLAESREKWIRDWKGSINHAKEEGQHEQAIMTAKKMLDKGFSPEEISDLTGLPREEILNIGS